MRRAFIIAAVVLVGAVENVEAKWLPYHFHSPNNPTPGIVPGAAGRKSFAGVPGLGEPLPPSPLRPGLNPVIGSVDRTGLFAHPHTGRTRYTGTAYDPILGRFSTYHFRR